MEHEFDELVREQRLARIGQGNLDQVRTASGQRALAPERHRAGNKRWSLVFVRIESAFDRSNISLAKGYPDSQADSQRPQAQGHFKPRQAIAATRNCTSGYVPPCQGMPRECLLSSRSQVRILLGALTREHVQSERRHELAQRCETYSAAVAT